MESQPVAIAKIRSFNRFYTHLLGLLDRHILDSDFSLTEARVLLEISREDGVAAHEIARRLTLDPSYLSRMLKGFETKGMLTKTPGVQDGRARRLAITEKGRLALAQLGQRSDAQVESLTAPLSPAELQAVLDAMALIRSQFSRAVFPAVIRGYQPGDETYLISRHETLYLQEHGLNEAFAGMVRELVTRLVTHLNPARECILIAEVEGRPMGSIAVADAGNGTAQLRFFLLEPEARGYGLGLRLAEAAMAFCRQAGYRHAFLETISLLTTARSIYRRMGFQLVHAHPQSDWGREVTEERWEADL